VNNFVWSSVAFGDPWMNPKKNPWSSAGASSRCENM
jgi:hypothetical protein